ncbi:hypothetical protein AO718_07840 [Aeromonas veronii]|nr:hypothetical protein AO728_10275 [Aeromonas veronii]KRV78002.1 hypothetical protein AO719_13640 [Aeromonas veronii]KRV79695.1 hypothetical protein AO718_07840 [Aeromonas veronii]KRV89015.1 hypothetical protein AO721_14500 [Aeromonas veronii]KRV90049.1 hypothetical protein AO739_14610 [Aeromonas veronii]
MLVKQLLMELKHRCRVLHKWFIAKPLFKELSQLQGLSQLQVPLLTLFMVIQPLLMLTRLLLWTVGLLCQVLLVLSSLMIKPMASARSLTLNLVLLEVHQALL